jgi:hypothetical protein
MLEVALDGALLKFLLDEVDDPVCHQVFEKINNDEYATSRWISRSST